MDLTVVSFKLAVNNYRHRPCTDWEIIKRGVHAHSYVMRNQGKMAGNSKICIGIQSQLFLPEFIYLRLSP